MEIYKSFTGKQKKIILIVLIFSVIGILIGVIYDFNQKAVEADRFVRPKSYEYSRDVDFKVDIEGIEKGENLSYSGELEARKLNENEIETYLNQALETVEKTMFREGESKYRVLTGIDIPGRLPENPVDISFSFSESGIMLDNGSINFDAVKEKCPVTVTILASYGEKEVVKSLDLIVYPRELTEEERITLAVKEKLDSVFASGENEIIELPKEVEGHKLKTYFPKEEVTGGIVGFTFLLIICLFVVFNEKNKKEIKNREEELKNAYTEFVGRFVILLGAGLSISAVWKKLEDGFASNKSLCEEVRLTLWEIGNGKTEREAYENFGKRIGGTQYAKFVSVINQSLKLGSGQLLERLEAESEAAMFERRNKAKVMGEVADTKLLMPMMLQLVLIMLIIMVPALMAV